MANILIIRFSALGDVAMTVPIIHSLATQYPQHRITVLSRDVFAPLFSKLPNNVDFIGADLQGEHKGLSGLNELFTFIKERKFDYVADFHNVLRSRYLVFRFKMIGVSAAHIDKSRGGKRKLVRKRNKIKREQISSFERYANVLRLLRLPIRIKFTSLFGEERGEFSQIIEQTGEKKETKWIGIAPFAKHNGKIYPLELQEQVVAYFAQMDKVRIFLFGGGEEEKSVFDEWITKYPTVTSMIGKLTMNTELILISHLDVMVSMDSANMHLASLVNTPVVSIWGATHPYCGFMGWKQSPENTIQVDLSCRPCSVFGQKPCFRGDYACLHQIEPATIIEKVKRVVGL